MSLVRLHFLIKCMTQAVGRLTTLEVVEAFVHQGLSIDLARGPFYAYRPRVLRVLTELGVSENERVAINQKAAQVRANGHGAGISFGRKGMVDIRRALDQIEVTRRCRVPEVGEGQLPQSPKETSQQQVPQVEAIVTLPLEILRTILGDNFDLLKNLVDDRRLSDEQFRGLAGIVLAGPATAE